MFCPTCGRENAVERKFCASCGTNLVAVFQALSGKDDDFFTRIDSGLDHFLARYSEHVFRNAPANAAEQRISKSWQVLGQGFLTSLVDLLLFTRQLGSLVRSGIPLMQALTGIQNSTRKEHVIKLLQAIRDDLDRAGHRGGGDLGAPPLAGHSRLEGQSHARSVRFQRSPARCNEGVPDSPRQPGDV